MHSFSLLDRVFSRKCALRSTLGLLAALGLSSVASAANVNLTADNSPNTTSFNTSLAWSNAAAPAAGNAYFTNDFLMRTPTDAVTAYTFAGDSLTVNALGNTFPATGAPTVDLNDCFIFKGTFAGATTLTVNNITVDGGVFRQASSDTNIFRLATNSFTVTTNGMGVHLQGPTYIDGPVHGSGNIVIVDNGSTSAARTLHFTSPGNDFTGNLNLVTADRSRFTLASTGVFKFVIGAAGVNNAISGAGVATFDGTFVFDLTAASTTIGDSWTLVTTGTLAETFGATFAITGFSETNNVWIGQLNGHYYQFTESTGVLTVIDTPPAFPPPTITSAPRSNTVVVGSNVTFSVTATGVGSLTYQWFKDSAPLSGQTGTTLSLTDVQTTASGTYSVTVTDHAAEASSLPATTTTVEAILTVITASDTTVAYYRFEEGTDTGPLFSATDSTSGANTLNTAGTASYSATVPYSKVPGTLAANTLSSAFPATGTNGLVSATSGSIATTVFDSFTVEAFVRFSALGGTQTIVGRDDTANPGDGVGAHSLFYLQKNPANQFRATFINKSNVLLDLTDNTTGFVAAAVDAWYHVAVVGDAAAGTVSLYVNGALRGSIPGFTGLFVPPSGSNTPWTVGRGQFNALNADYLRGFVDEVRITRVALAPTQFLNSDGVRFYVNPIITQAPINQTVRVGGNASFSVTATGTGLTYQWYKGGLPISGETGATLNLTSVTAAADDTYSVTVTDPVGANIGVSLTSSASVVLRVLDVPAASRALSLNFVGAATNATWSAVIGTMLPADSAGIVPVVNWNNSASATGVSNPTSPLALSENTGASSSATALWTSTNTWAARAADPVVKTPDNRLFHGYIESRADTGSTVTVSNIPYASYDVYVYFAGGTAGTIGKTAINRVGSPTYYYRLTAHDAFVLSPTNPLPLMIGTSIDAATAATAPTATFVRFAGVTGADLTISTSDNTLNANAGGIAAISIVDRTPAGTPYSPAATLSPVSQLKAGGSSATFSVSATSNNSGGVLSYQWQKDGVNIGGQTGTSLVLSNLTGSATGTYSVVVTDTSSLGVATTTKAGSLIVVDATRPLLINGDINTAATPTFVGNGILRPTGLNHTGSELGTDPAVIWNGVLGAAGTATRTLAKESTGLSLPGVSFTYAGAEGVEDNATAGGITSSAAVALSREYLYTDNQATALTASIGGLDAFVGKKVTLLVYAYGKLTTAFFEAATSDTATVTLASANNHLGTAPKATTTTEDAGRKLEDNNLGTTGGVSAAYVSFDGVVAPGGTVSWSLGADTDAGRIPLVGFQLLVTGEDIAPPAPTNLAAVGGDDQVALTWTASSGASTYTIRRSTTSGGPYTTISAGAVSVTNYTDTTAVNGTTYYYVVAAANALAVSSNSNEASATPASGTTALQNWRFTHFGSTANTGNGANTSDPDGDGMINLLEYALGTIPTTAGVSPLVLGQSGGALTLTFSPVVDANLTYIVEASSNLAGAWETAHNYGSFASTTPVTYTDSIVVNGSNPRRFLRLRVTTSE